MKRILAIWLSLLCLTSHALSEGVTLEVTSDPPGALVVIDRIVRGNTPLTIENLAPGVRQLRVSHGEEYRPYQVELTIEEGRSEECHVQLVPRSSTSLKQGVKAYKEGRAESAVASLTRATVDTPVQPEAYYWLGLIARDRDLDGAAVEHFRNFLQFYPTRSDVHFELAELHYRKGDLASALTSYKLALLNDKRFTGALDNMGATTWEQIKAAGEPTEPLEQLKLAYRLEQKGRISDAARWAQAAALSAFPSLKRRPLR